MSEQPDTPAVGGRANRDLNRRARFHDPISVPVVDAAPNPVLAIDADGYVAYVNPQVEGAFGYAPEELLGQPVEILLPSRLAKRHVRHRTAFVEQPNARPMGIGRELAGRRKDGSEFPVEISLAPVTTGQELYVFATVVDITARKSAEQELLQAKKMESIGRLAGGIAHDFNNSLSAIHGFAELLHDDLELDPLPPVRDLQHSVEAVRGAADRAAVLTAQLLAFSRRQVLVPAPLNLAIAVRAVEPMLRRLIGEQVHLRLKLDPGTGIVRADPGQVDQILLNLVVNAKDAMPEGGTVTIETGNVTLEEPYAIEHFELAPGPYVMLTVTDTGSGMERETRERIFEPFFTTKEQGRGTGLGLATTYGIVRQSGGHIRLYSEPGKGTSFKLYFPRVEITQEEAEALAARRRPIVGKTRYST